MTSSTRCDLSDSGVSGISICPAATASVRCRTRRRKGILSGRRSSSYEYTGINESLSGSQCSCIVPCASAGQACEGCEVYTCYVSLIGVIHSTLVPVERAIARARCVSLSYSFRLRSILCPTPSMPAGTAGTSNTTLETGCDSTTRYM